MEENGYNNKFLTDAADPAEGKVLKEYFPSHPMSELIQDVRYFHLACNIPILMAPTLPSPERVELRKNLTIEEHEETIKAMDEGDLVGIADGIADTIYIALGNALEFGIPLEYVWAEVQRSNMAKVDPVTGKVRRREDGKVLKPEGWTPPDIAGIMENL